MRRHVWLLPFAAVVVVGVCFLSVVRARDDDDDKKKMEDAKKAAPDVLGLADAVASGNPDALKKQADAVVKKYDELMPIMWQMKPRDKNGLGVGPKADVYVNDAIELQLLELGGKKSKNAQYIKDHAADFQRMAEVVRGIAAVAPPFGKKGGFAKTPADEKVWNSLCEDMAKGSDDLIDAIKKDDDKAFKKAVDNLNKSCNDCHTKFRDN